MKKFILMSYPRSGSSLVSAWIRAMDAKKNRIKKTHLVEPIYYPVLFLLRNYKECITRHLGRHKPMTEKAFVKGIEGKNAVGYMPLLKHFDRSKRDNLLLYYEDFIVDKQKAVKKLGKWLEIDKNILKDVVDNIEKISNDELKRYELKKPSFTKGKHLIFHSEHNDPETNDFSDNYIREKYPGLYQKYLKRYSR